jgi:hypothetical protein
MAFAQLNRWMWRLASGTRGLLGRGAERRARTADDSRRIEARTRFWAELREGQREAETHSGRRDR